MPTVARLLDALKSPWSGDRCHAVALKMHATARERAASVCFTRLRRTATFLRNNLLGAIALVVALTGASYAIASTRSKTLNVCRLKHSHDLVVAGKGVKCAGAKVTIGLPGPPGATGATGVTGATGPAGPKGDAGPTGLGIVSATYKTAGDAGLIPIPADPHFNGVGGTPAPTPVVSVQLSAGSYWITGKLTGQDTVPPQGYSLDCEVVNGSAPLPVDVEHGTFVANINNNVPYDFAAPLTLASSATLTLQCDSQRNTNVQTVRLAAIQVQNLTQSP